MYHHLRTQPWLLFLSVMICVVLYLWLYGLGQTVFRNQAEGSLIRDKRMERWSDLVDRSAIHCGRILLAALGGLLCAAASGASNWGLIITCYVSGGAAIGPIAKYRGLKRATSRAGYRSLVSKNQFAGKSGIVAQWADAHQRSGPELESRRTS